MGKDTFELNIIINDSETPITIRVHPYQKLSEIRDIVENRIKHKIFSFHGGKYWDVHKDHMNNQVIKNIIINEFDILYTYTTDYEKIKEKIKDRILGSDNIPRYPMYGGIDSWLQELEKL